MPSVQALGKALSDSKPEGLDLRGRRPHRRASAAKHINQDLSERRADTIKQLSGRQFGIAGGDLVTVGYGKTKLKDAADRGPDQPPRPGRQHGHQDRRRSDGRAIDPPAAVSGRRMLHVQVNEITQALAFGHRRVKLRPEVTSATFFGNDHHEKAFVDGGRRSITSHCFEPRRQSRRRCPAPAAPAAAPTDSAPANVARPSIAPKSNDTAAKPDASAKPQADAEPAPRRHRRYARRHYHRYAYWEPFPIYLPHLTRRHGIYWNRIPWFF